MAFVSSQSDGGFVSSLSSDPSPASAKSRDEQPMYPVTAKQIAEASPSAGDKSNFAIDGVDVYNVKLVGIVYDKSARATDVTFVVDDGTGRIECHRWVNDPNDTKEVENLTEGTYVRINGHLKSFQGKKRVVVFAIRPVIDYNEVANHFIECVHAHCCSGKAQTTVSAPSTSPSSIGTSTGYQTASSNEMPLSQQYNLDGVEGIDKMVLACLQQHFSLAQGNGNGVHRNEIAKTLKLTEENVTKALAALGVEGLVYSTIDDFHYNPTS